MDLALISDTPLVVLFLGTVLLAVGCTEAGHKLGAKKRKRTDQEKTEPVSAMGGTLLGLLAFLLAFTFGLAADRFDTRRSLVLKEANAIGTCHLRAGLLPPTQKEHSRRLLREYVQVRLAWAAKESSGDAKHSTELHEQLWATAEDAAAMAPEPEYGALFVESVNEVIDLHEERVMARAHINGTIWAALYLVTVLAFAASGYHAGLHASSRSPVMIGVAIAFAVVICLVADLDRPMDGMISIDQRAMVDLQEAIGKP